MMRAKSDNFFQWIICKWGPLKFFVVAIVVTVWIFGFIEPLNGAFREINNITVGITIAIFLHQQWLRWESNLPKKLHVFYVQFGYPDSVYIEVTNMDISSEGDIRQVCQNYGRQITGYNLDLTMKMDTIKRNVKLTDNICVYEVNIYLRAMPSNMVKKFGLAHSDVYREFRYKAYYLIDASAETNLGEPIPFSPERVGVIGKEMAASR